MADHPQDENSAPNQADPQPAVKDTKENKPGDVPQGAAPASPAAPAKNGDSKQGDVPK